MATIDGIIAVALFILFVSWSFVYYFNVLSIETARPLDDTVNSIRDTIAEAVTVDFYEMPVSHTSAGNVSDAVFYSDYVWSSEGAKNSTRVFNDSGAMLACNLTGNRLYWLSDAAAGENYFTITYSDENSAMNCTGGDLGNPVNKTVPWSAVKKSVVSQNKITDMTNSGYRSFKIGLGIDRDFRVIINITDVITEYGMSPPNSSDVFSMVSRHATYDGNEAEMRILVW